MLALGWKPCGFSLCFLEEVNTFCWEKGEEGEKRWKKWSLSNQQLLVRSGSAFKGHRKKKKRQIPGNHPQGQLYPKPLQLLLCFILQPLFGEGTHSTSPPCTVWCYTMDNWVLTAAQVSVASISCCLMIFFFPNRAIHSVEIYFKEFRTNSLHFQILKDGNCFTFARLISY